MTERLDVAGNIGTRFTMRCRAVEASDYFAIPWLIPSAILVCLPLLAVLLLIWARVKRRMLGE